MLPRRHRLTRSADFGAVLRGARGRRRAATPLLVVHCGVPAHGVRLGTAEQAGTRPARIGFTVSKAVGNSVVRHRVTRRLRALAAARVASLALGTDLVIRANPAAAQANSDQLGDALDAALARLAPRHTAGVGR